MNIKSLLKIQIQIESYIILGEDATGTNNEVSPGGDYKTNERPYPPYIPPRLTPSADETFTAPIGTRAELRCSVKHNGKI